MKLGDTIIGECTVTPPDENDGFDLKPFTFKVKGFVKRRKIYAYGYNPNAVSIIENGHRPYEYCFNVVDAKMTRLVLIEKAHPILKKIDEEEIEDDITRIEIDAIKSMGADFAEEPILLTIMASTNTETLNASEDPSFNDLVEAELYVSEKQIDAAGLTLNNTVSGTLCNYISNKSLDNRKSYRVTVSSKRIRL